MLETFPYSNTNLCCMGLTCASLIICYNMMLKDFVEIPDGIIIFRIRSLTKESRKSAKVFGKRECIKVPDIYSPFLFKCLK